LVALFFPVLVFDLLFVFLPSSYPFLLIFSLPLSCSFVFIQAFSFPFSQSSRKISRKVSSKEKALSFLQVLIIVELLCFHWKSPFKD